eukprot:14220178-Heterocapsa_arctica.AAC.1
MPWCSTCVRGRGRDTPHHGVPARGIPLVQWDYTFFKSLEEQDVLSPILVGYWTGRGYGYAGVTIGKGAIADKAI